MSGKIKNVLPMCLLLVVLVTPIALATDVNQPPELLWKFQGEDKPVYSAPAVNNDTVYYATENTVYAVENGKELWEYNSSIGIRADLYYNDSKLIFGDLNGNITVLNATNAEVLWTYHTNRSVYGAPRVFDNKVYAASTDGYLYCLDMAGRLLWSFKTDDVIDSTPLIYDGKVLFDSDDLHFYALDANSGNLLWKSKIKGQSGPEAVAIDGKIFTSTYLGAIYSFDSRNGHQEWQYVANPPEVYGSILADKDRLYVTTPYGTIYSLNPLTGGIFWSNNTTYNLHLDMSMFGDKLIVLDKAGYLMEVNKYNGTILSRIKVTDGLLKRGQKLTDSGILYFGDNRGCLYAYKISDFETQESNHTVPVALGGIVLLVFLGLCSFVYIRLKR